MIINRPLKAIRLKCLDCCNDGYDAVKFCTVYGCTLWPYRFGKRPQSVAKELVTPELMPDTSLSVEECAIRNKGTDSVSTERNG